MHRFYSIDFIVTWAMAVCEKRDEIVKKGKAIHKLQMFNVKPEENDNITATSVSNEAKDLKTFNCNDEF